MSVYLEEENWFYIIPYKGEFSSLLCLIEPSAEDSRDSVGFIYRRNCKSRFAVLRNRRYNAPLILNLLHGCAITYCGFDKELILPYSSELPLHVHGRTCSEIFAGRN